MDAASAELDEAGRRQAEIDRLIRECDEKLAQLKHKHTKAGGGGSGRWSKPDQKRKDALEHNQKLLRSGILPSERRAAAERASAAAVQESARQNAPHHAASQPLPSGRPSSSAAGSGGAAGGSGGTAGRASEPDHDDGEEDDMLRKANYYTITPQQRAFNEEKTLHFINNAAKLSHAYFEPPDVSKSGCDPKFIGVGKVHVHAPHLFLGLAKPPCPTCGWNVDSNTVKTKGVCGARRVYAAEIDEWVSGQKMLCTVCKQGRDRLKAEWQASPHPNSNPNPNPNPNPDPNPDPNPSPNAHRYDKPQPYLTPQELDERIARIQGDGADAWADSFVQNFLSPKGNFASERETGAYPPTKLPTTSDPL